MSEFVKGEWRLNHYHFPHQFIVAHGDEDDNDAFPGQRKICDIWDWNTEKGRANARLITSAPKLKQQRDDLLAALKQISDIEDARYTHAGFDLEVNNISKAAIAKCEG